MLHDFLAKHRGELITRCRAKVALRASPQSDDQEFEPGVALFLDQLMKTLRVEQSPQPLLSRKVSGPAGGEKSVLSEIGEAASRHGNFLFKHGFTVEQVVHDYGDLCQAITDLAFELKETIEIDEFRTMNRCLDNGIAVAVTEYSYQRDCLVSATQTDLMNERLGIFAHELRNLVNTATLALTVIKAGNVGLGGATGTVLDKSLVGLRNLIDRSLVDVRMKAGLEARQEVFSLREFIEEVKLSATLEAKVKECTLTVTAVDPSLAVDADRDLLLGAVGNLIYNAFKFTRPCTEVTLNAYAVADRILIDVADHCGGLPRGLTEELFQPFTQNGGDRSGLGLGLTIARRSVEANDGRLSARDLPGVGCVFSIELPRHTWETEPALAFNDEAYLSQELKSEPLDLPSLSEAARKLKILVAEDNSASRNLLSYIFGRLGLAMAVLVEDGAAAVKRASEEDFDVIFLDCNMPTLDGHEAARKIRKLERQSPGRKKVSMVAITGAVFDDDRRKAFQAGMDLYLNKPIRLQAIAEVLEQVASA